MSLYNHKLVSQHNSALYAGVTSEPDAIDLLLVQFYKELEAIEAKQRNLEAKQREREAKCRKLEAASRVQQGFLREEIEIHRKEVEADRKELDAQGKKIADSKANFERLMREREAQHRELNNAQQQPSANPGNDIGQNAPALSGNSSNQASVVQAISQIPQAPGFLGFFPAPAGALPTSAIPSPVGMPPHSTPPGSQPGDSSGDDSSRGPAPAA